MSDPPRDLDGTVGVIDAGVRLVYAAEVRDSN